MRELANRHCEPREQSRFAQDEIPRVARNDSAGFETVTQYPCAFWGKNA
jgi:hypothetical protein